MNAEKTVPAKHARWLLAELPIWEAEGLLSAGQTDALRIRYAQAAAGRNWATTLFFVAGLLVAGLGIVLILAHNWEEFSRPLRAALSITPLLLALVLGYFTLWYRPDSPMLREGTGAFLATAVAAAISLIGQTYQLPSNLWSFLLTCLVLVIPAAYVLRSATPAVLAFLGLAVMSAYLRGDPYRYFQFYLLLGAAVGYLALVARKDRFGTQTAILGWAAALGLAVSLDGLLGFGMERLAYPLLFTAMLSLARTRFSNAPDVWRRGFEIVGGCGVVITCLASGTITTRPAGWSSVLAELGNMSPIVLWNTGALASLMALAMLLWLDGLRTRDTVAKLFGAAWMPAIISEGILSLLGDKFLVPLVNSLYLLTLGVGLIWSGTRERSLGRVNVGALALAALLLWRFFDQRYTFVARGSVFLAAGLGFILLHLWARRRLGRAS